MFLHQRQSYYIDRQSYYIGVGITRISTVPVNTGNIGKVLEFEIGTGNTGKVLEFQNLV